MFHILQSWQKLLFCPPLLLAGIVILPSAGFQSVKDVSLYYFFLHQNPPRNAFDKNNRIAKAIWMWYSSLRFLLMGISDWDKSLNGMSSEVFFGLEPRTEEMGLEDPHLL